MHHLIDLSTGDFFVWVIIQNPNDLDVFLDYQLVSLQRVTLIRD
jgi:hypothetical protein